MLKKNVEKRKNKVTKNIANKVNLFKQKAGENKKQ